MIPYRINPMGITLVETIPLTLTAASAGSTVTLNATGSPTVSGLHYRLGTSGPWIPYTIGTTIPLDNIGDRVQFWNSADTLSLSSINYVQFAMTGQIGASGKVNSLLNGAALSTSCFRNLFSGCSALKSAPELPNEPAVLQCYYGMFTSSGIVHPPELPALILATSCYTTMFAYCADLIETPVLPAPYLSTQCYFAMFRGCSSITSVVLPAATLDSTCYRQMFQDASALSSVEVGFSQWNDSLTATDNWMLRVAASGTFIKPAALPEEYGENRIPSGWTVVNK